MPDNQIYRELSKKLMMENSRILPEIWKLLTSESDAEMINLLPASVEELSEKTGKDTETVQDILDIQYHRGTVFDYVRDGITYYRMARQIVQFHDSTLAWAEAPRELIDLWVEFMDSEYPQLLELVTQVKFPSFMRVIPVNETVDAKNRVLAFEDAEKIIHGATNLAVTDCVCRKSMDKCNAPREACIQINRGADYTLKRGTGRKIDADEAFAILKKSEEAGLVHLTENRAEKVNAICNCCTCCCEMLRFASNVKTSGVLAPSRFNAAVDAGLCTACENCIETCPMDAIFMGDDTAVVDQEKCIGCGLCAAACPVEAIDLKETRPEDFVPSKR